MIIGPDAKCDKCGSGMCKDCGHCYQNHKDTGEVVFCRVLNCGCYLQYVDYSDKDATADDVDADD